MDARSAFERAFVVFRAAPYPDYPQEEELQEWNSGLLTIDGHIAGYATRVHRGSLHAREIPDLDKLALRVRELRGSLEAVPSASEQGRQLIGEYRTYIAALDVMVQELARLARQEPAG
jgi:hypothetical protein